MNVGAIVTIQVPRKGESR